MEMTARKSIALSARVVSEDRRLLVRVLALQRAPCLVLVMRVATIIRYLVGRVARVEVEGEKRVNGSKSKVEATKR